MTYRDMALRTAIGDKFLDFALTVHDRDDPAFIAAANHELDIPLPTNIDEAVKVGDSISTIYGPQVVTADAIAAAHERYDPVLTSANAVRWMYPATQQEIDAAILREERTNYSDTREADIARLRKWMSQPEYTQMERWADLFASGAPRQTIQVSEAALDGDI